MLEKVLQDERTLSQVPPERVTKSIPQAVTTSLNATWTEKIGYLHQVAGYPINSPLQLPLNYLSGISSTPVWGRSMGDQMSIQFDNSTSTISTADIDVVFRQGLLVASELRSAHSKLLSEFEHLSRNGLLQEDSECITDADADTDTSSDVHPRGNVGRWFRYETERPQFGQEVDDSGCSTASPVLCAIVRILLICYQNERFVV